MSTDDTGVVFPAGPDGRRSTAAVGRAVVADALRRVDPTGARAAETETNWRAGYLVHFRRLVEAGLASPEAALCRHAFAGAVPGPHLDVAGPARAGSGDAEVVKGGTAFGTRLLLRWLEAGAQVDPTPGEVD